MNDMRACYGCQRVRPIVTSINPAANASPVRIPGAYTPVMQPLCGKCANKWGIPRYKVVRDAEPWPEWREGQGMEEEAGR